MLGPEEDTLTLAVAAAKQALERSGDRYRKNRRAVALGTGTSPYATKAAATVMVDALGLPNSPRHRCAVRRQIRLHRAAGWQPAMIESGQIEYALVVGADTMNRHTRPEWCWNMLHQQAQWRSVLGKENLIATLEAMATHSPRPERLLPRGGRTLHPIRGRILRLGVQLGICSTTSSRPDRRCSAKTGPDPADFAKFAVPQKTGIRPLMTMGKLELEMMQVLPFVLTAQIGDCGAAGCPLSLAHILDFAEPGERIGVIDYGAGAGCDAWSLVCTDAITNVVPQSGLVIEQLEDKIMVDYATMTQVRTEVHPVAAPPEQFLLGRRAEYGKNQSQSHDGGRYDHTPEHPHGLDLAADGGRSLLECPQGEQHPGQGCGPGSGQL